MKHTIIAALSLSALTSAGLALSDPGAAPASETEPAKRETPISKGEIMPGFALKNEKGETVTLGDALKSGPVVVTFYRGAWCPYCVKALGSIEESVGDINKLGATVLAISPQLPEHSIDLREKIGLSYQLLVDADNRLGDQLGLMFTLDEATVEKYRKYGIDVGASNGTDAWQLPIPATFVIDTDGTIRYAWTNADYTKRAPVNKVLGTLREISNEG